MKKVFYIFTLVMLLLSSCKTIDKEEEKEDLEEMSLNTRSKLSDRNYNPYNDPAWGVSDPENEVIVFEIGRTEDGNIEYVKATSENVTEDPICALKSAILDIPDSVVIITPNPTSAAANIKLFSNFINRGYKLTNPIKVDFQLLHNERIIHQWSISNYNYTIVPIPVEYIQEDGTYLLLCNFTGPKGCTKSYATPFMVVKR